MLSLIYCTIYIFFDIIFRLGRRNPSVNEQQLEKFKAAIVEVLRRRYRDHWFPEKPFKGSGYRCIRINGKMDPVIAQAAETCGLAANLIHSVSSQQQSLSTIIIYYMSIRKCQRFKIYFLYFQTFPSELTMWIDPLEVSYRIGENGSICVLYEHKGSKKEESTDSTPEAWRPTTSNSTSSTANVVVSKPSGKYLVVLVSKFIRMYELLSIKTSRYQYYDFFFRHWIG